MAVGNIQSGETPSASITGTAPDYVINLTLPKGDKGDNFTVNQTGLYENLSAYNDQPKGFSYLATDTGSLYIKMSDTPGDWS